MKFKTCDFSKTTCVNFAFVAVLLSTLLIMGCGGGGGGGSANIEKLAEDAESTAPWKDEPVVELTTEAEKKAALEYIDGFLTFIDSESFGKKGKKGDVENFDDEFAGDVSGNVIIRGNAVADSDDEDVPFYWHASGSYDFQGYVDDTYSVNGKTTFSAKGSFDEFGDNIETVTTLDGGLSYIDNTGVHVVYMHWVVTVKGAFGPATYTATVNGTTVSGELSE